MAAYEDLLRPNLAAAARLARALLGGPEEAEDAVQEAAFKAWRKLSNLRPGTSFRPWFLGIVVRQVRTIQRTRWWTVIRLPSVTLQASDRGQSWLEAEDLRRAIARLPRSQREAVLMHYYLDLPLQDVAVALGLTRAGLKSRINRALRQLRAEITVSEVVV